MLISVIIPHLNQEAYLGACLRCLAAHRGAVEIEIIVVDNGSTRLPEAVCADFPNVVLLSEPEPGPGPARNRGVAAAKGDILAFTDADCRPDPDWIAEIAAAFANTKAEIVGGDVRVDYVDPEHPTFVEPYEAIYTFRNREHIAQGFSVTANLATRPAVMAAVGPFAGIDVSEDHDWGLRANRLGYAIRYVPEMIVRHPARASFAELRIKWDRHIAHDHALAAQRRFWQARWLARATAVAGSPLFEIPTLLNSSRVHGAGERLSAFVCLVVIRAYRGYAMARLALASDPARRDSGWRRWNRGEG